MTRPVDAPRTWRQQLDARIDRCPGCDDWRWERGCRRCDGKRKWQPFDQWMKVSGRAA